MNRIIARALVTISAACEQGKQHGLRSYFVGLTQSPLTADQRLRDVWSSLKPVVPASLSMEGIEGPGNWALNKKCYVTVVLVKNGKVAFNYAALSPADSDYELLRLELSKLLGVKIDAKPPGFDRGGMMGAARGAADVRTRARTRGLTGARRARRRSRPRAARATASRPSRARRRNPRKSAAPKANERIARRRGGNPNDGSDADHAGVARHIAGIGPRGAVRRARAPRPRSRSRAQGEVRGGAPISPCASSR